LQLGDGRPTIDPSQIQIDVAPFDTGDQAPPDFGTGASQ
jgi:hypothetical protein